MKLEEFSTKELFYILCRIINDLPKFYVTESQGRLRDLIPYLWIKIKDAGLRYDIIRFIRRGIPSNGKLSPKAKYYISFIQNEYKLSAPLEITNEIARRIYFYTKNSRAPMKILNREDRQNEVIKYIDNISKILGVSHKEMSGYFKTNSRNLPQYVENWRARRCQPSDGNFMKLKNLNETANDFEKLQHLAKLKLFDDKSIFDLLISNEYSSKYLEALSKIDEIIKEVANEKKS